MLRLRRIGACTATSIVVGSFLDKDKASRRAVTDQRMPFRWHLWCLTALTSLQLAACEAAEGDHLASIGTHSLAVSGHGDLPRGCTSYTDRYGTYLSSSMQQMFDPNDLFPHAKHVLAVKLHYGVKWSKDLVLFLHSVAHELSAAGMHMYLLVQDSPERLIGADDTPEKFRGSLPLPLRPMLFLFDEEDVHNAYPKLHDFQAHLRDYLPFVYFLHRFPGYQFAWYMEYDVRYTGASFADFLQALLSIADNELRARQPSETEQLGGSLHSRRELRSRSLPESSSGSLVPDLLFLGPPLDKGYPITADPNTHPRDYDPSRWNMTSSHKRMLMLMGMSQKFSRILHEWSVAGQGGYLEYFIPSLAHAKNLTSVGVEVDQYNGESYHCCFPDTAKKFYSDFVRHKSECYPSAILHPVKTDDSSWEPFTHPV